MRRGLIVAVVAVAAVLGGCGDGARPTPTGTATTPAPTTPAPTTPGFPTRSVTPPEGAKGRNGEGTAVLIGAGDIATCDAKDDERTARIVQDTPGAVFTLGDLAYPDGSAQDFARCYGPTWGRFKARTRPVIGNHEYVTGRGAPYFDYFGRAAGEPGRGWYSYDLGSWHVVVLNSNCGSVPGGCGAGSAQERWLRADLAANRSRCTAAMWHHPLFTSGKVHGPEEATRPLFRALVAGGAEVLITGHNHQYERFAPQSGVREFVVGTGGGPLYPFKMVPAPGSEVRDNSTHGVLRLTLRSNGYDWKFLPARGSFTDAGSDSCH